MKIQSGLLAGALCLASVTFLSAKTYDLRIGTAVTAGSVQLPAGEYRLKLDGNQAVFTGVNDHKSFTTPVTIETVEQKYNDTAVLTSSQGETQKIDSIELGGSNTKVDFK